MLLLTLLIASLSATTVISAKWTQVVASTDARCSNVASITQSPMVGNADAICGNLNGSCVATGPAFLATSCIDDATKNTPEAVKSGQWFQTKIFTPADCSGDPYAIVYQRSAVCQRTGPSSWSKFTCDGASVTGYECKDDKCNNCVESGKIKTNFCNATNADASPFKSQYISCFNSGQMQSNAVRLIGETLAFGFVPLILELFVSLF